MTGPESEVIFIRKHIIDYACVCSTGKLRKNNEDNFYCGGRVREDIYANEDVAVSGTVASDTNELFAVFDGMGGEACGEIASFAAASHAELFARDRGQYEEYLYELAEHLNEKIADETEARSLVLMGTTAAMLQISGEDVYILNAGDSRIYKLASHELRQISQDHIAPAYGGRAITKFLGMPAGTSLSPYIAMGKYKAGDVFLLCSDGVTDMLTDDEIRLVLDDRRPVADLCRALVDAALEKGGADNTTAILLRVVK